MLTALLMVASAASLSGEVKDAPYSARLLAQAELPAATVSRGALEAERTRILETRPSLGFPITMMSIGAGTSALFIAITAGLANGNASGAYYTVSDGVFIFLGVVIAATLGLVAIGIISLIFRISERNLSEPRLTAIDKQLEKLGPRTPADDLAPLPPGPPPPPPGPDPGPPGPPPPPPPPLALLTF